MFVHDIIKIRYTEQGYLKNYPYHLISDKEMFTAFLPNTDGYSFFTDYYPAPTDTTLTDIVTAYNNLILAIRYHINQFMESDDYTIPDWIYSYMLGVVIGPKSDTQDIHDVIKPLDVDNIDDIFDDTCYSACLRESKEWLRRTTDSDSVDYEGQTIETRPPTVFGEPHIIKSIRVDSAKQLM